MKDTDARTVTYKNRATAPSKEKMYRTDKNRMYIIFALILSLTVLFLSSCAPVGKCDWLAELKAEGRYDISVTDSDGTEYKGEFYIGAAEKNDTADAVRDYTFVYDAPEALAGIKTVYSDGRIAVTLKDYAAEITLPTALEACIPELVAGFFEAGSIKEVRAGGTYTEVVTGKAVYCVDKDGNIAEILPASVNDSAANDGRNDNAEISKNIILRIKLSPLQKQN